MAVGEKHRLYNNIQLLTGNEGNIWYVGPEDKMLREAKSKSILTSFLDDMPTPRRIKVIEVGVFLYKQDHANFCQFLKHFDDSFEITV